jgi:PKD repeat protein
MIKRNFAVLPLFLLLGFAGCSKNEPVPAAAFAYSAGNQFKAPCTVQFTNQSSQAFSYDWWFGTDSSVAGIDAPGSTLRDPEFTYSKPGAYTITLRAYTESRKEWATAKQVITIKDTARQVPFDIPCNRQFTIGRFTSSD